MQWYPKSLPALNLYMILNFYRTLLFTEHSLHNSPMKQLLPSIIIPFSQMRKLRSRERATYPSQPVNVKTQVESPDSNLEVTWAKRGWTAPRMTKLWFKILP